MQSIEVPSLTVERKKVTHSHFLFASIPAGIWETEIMNWSEHLGGSDSEKDYGS